MKRFVILSVLLAASGLIAFAILPGPSAATLVELPVYSVDQRDVVVSVTEQGTLESANNTEIKCRVRGDNTITFVIESGTQVEEGEILIQLETLAIEEEISERTKFFHLAESAAARSRADVERAKIAIDEYQQGLFPSELASLKKDLAVAESRLLNATNRLKHSRMMSRSEYASELEVEEREFAAKQASLNVDLIQTRMEVLEQYTQQEELVRLRGELQAAIATHEADLETALADKKRLDRALEELELCTIRAQRAGLVIYPNSQQWEEAPEIEAGATVKKDQTLLLMPDLTQMQVKVGVHESVIDRMQTGMDANVTLNRNPVAGQVSYVASVAQPAGWWTGNVVKYDSIVSLPNLSGLRPGMSAEVEVIFGRYPEALAIPANACVESGDGFVCWVKKNGLVQRRELDLGDGNEMFIVVRSGLQSGEQVILDPLTHLPEAQLEIAGAVEQASDSQFRYEDL
ncbi:MAG: efflux RND transporter periplasmic adaptor subunit [Rubripirellula sp.]